MPGAHLEHHLSSCLPRQQPAPLSPRQQPGPHTCSSSSSPCTTCSSAGPAKCSYVHDCECDWLSLAGVCLCVVCGHLVCVCVCVQGRKQDARGSANPESRTRIFSLGQLSCLSCKVTFPVLVPLYVFINQTVQDLLLVYL